MPKDYVDFLKNKALVAAVSTVVEKIKASAENEVRVTGIDPFSALYECMAAGISLAEWRRKEQQRQAQKTMQNAIGEFHQGILGSMKGCKDLRTGSGGLDVENIGCGWFAEIKNKHNTVKGSDKKVIYDLLEAHLGIYEKKYRKPFVGYYVEIIPNMRRAYDLPFCPPDNLQRNRKPRNESIRIISGPEFYDLASGAKNTLRKLYMALPKVIHDIYKIEKSLSRENLEELYGSSFAP